MSKTKTSKSKSKSRTVRVRAADLPRRTAADAARLRRNTQGAADTSDIKPVTQADVHSGRVKIRRRPREPKVSLTIRLDKDLVERFKAGGEGYQTRINDALRAYLTIDDDPKATLDKIEALLKQVRERVA